jgi:K+-transporting ATPase c subunit
VRGTYYVTVEGRLAYRLAQWLTHRVEQQKKQTGNNGEGNVDVEFDESTEDDGPLEEEVDLEAAAEHLERVSDQIESVQDKIEDVADLIEEAQDTLEEEDEDDDEDDVDDFDWED